MSEVDVRRDLRSAADEAPYAAQKAREFADLFDEYAEALLLTGGQGAGVRQRRDRAGEALRLAAEAVAASDKWVASAAQRGGWH